MEKQKKEYILAFYVLLIVILTAIGFKYPKQVSRGTLNAHHSATAGFALGVLISLGLWEAWGKSNSY